jgi:hypothetical protein
MTTKNDKNFPPSRNAIADDDASHGDRTPASGFHFPNDPRSRLITG